MKKVISLLLALLMLVPVVSCFAVPTAAFTLEDQAKNKEAIAKFFKETMKVNEAVICGVLSNIQSESGFNPEADYVEADGAVSFGICQWNKGRKERLIAFCEENKYDYMSLEGQLWYLKHELEGDEKAAWGTVKNVSNDKEGAYVAGYNWAYRFERCAAGENNKNYIFRATRAAEEYWSAYGIANAVSPYAEIKEGIYYLKNVATGKYMTVKDGADADKTNIYPDKYIGGETQAFEITKGAYGYKMRPLCSEKRVANVYASTVAGGKNVCLWNETGDFSQLWYFSKTANEGEYIIHNIQNQACVLDITGTGSNDIGVITKSETKNQRWYLQAYCYHKNTELRDAKPATCMETGYSGDLFCLDCQWLVKQGEEITSLNHDFESSVVLPTPAAMGYTKHVCKLCQYTYTDTETTYNPQTYPKAAATSDYGTDGEEVSITVSASNFPDVKNLVFSNISYDQTVMSLEKVEWLISGGGGQMTDGVCAITFDAPAQISGDVLKLTFKIAKRAKHGQYPVTFNVDAAYAVAGGTDMSIRANVTGGTVEIGPCVHKGGLEYFSEILPDCYEDGRAEHYYCDYCKGYFRNAEGTDKMREAETVLYSDGHVYDTFYTVDTAPTETKEGSRSVHCQNCDAKKNVTVMPAKNTIQKGDYNGDGNVTMADVLAARKYVVGAFTDGDWLYIESADTDGDQNPTMRDVLNTRKIIIGG